MKINSVFFKSHSFITDFLLILAPILFILITQPAYLATSPKLDLLDFRFKIPGSIKGVVKAKNSGGQETFVADAKLKLTNREVKSFILTTVSDASGNFIFENVPAGKYILTVEAEGLPTLTKDILLDAGAFLNIEVNMDVSVNETVIIKEEEGLLSTSETSTSNIVRAETLKSQPLRDDNYQNSLPLTPGVIQDSNGQGYLKGSRSGQSNYTVNGADVTDPISGEPFFELPLEAVSSVKIEESAYSAEYGNFSGGVVSLVSKGGGDKFKISTARLFPTFHNAFSGKIDSFRPRLTFSGPLIKDRLKFLQSFEYRFRRTFIPSIKSGLDNTILERFNSFTQIDLTINKTNSLKVNFAFYPQKTRYYGLNTFNPAETTANIKQRGYLFSISEQAVFSDTSFLSSTVNYNAAQFNSYGTGSKPLTIVSTINSGSYFANTFRDSKRLEIQETYYFRPFENNGKHSLKVGGEFAHTNLSVQYIYNSILLRRLDNTLSQRIDFVNPSKFNTNFNNLSAFVQNNWVVNPKITLDLGLRYDRNGISKNNNFSPRFSFMFSPAAQNRTIIRGGIGIFYDRTLPFARYFADSSLMNGINQLPNRVITNYAANGITISEIPRFFSNQAEQNIKSPRSIRWSLYLDQGLTKNLTIRFGYLERRTKNELIVEPISNTLLLTDNGQSRYREFQILSSYIFKKFGQFNASYTFSKATGDLNAIETIAGDSPTFTIQPNAFSRQNFDSPHRFILYGLIPIPWDIRVSPLVEYRTGFPFSAVNDRLEFVGERNLAGRFPDYFSLDLQVTKGFRIPLPLIKKYKLRVGVAMLNLTDHFNPREIQNNVNNPNYKQFYNSLGFGTKFKFDVEM